VNKVRVVVVTVLLGCGVAMAQGNNELGFLLGGHVASTPGTVAPDRIDISAGLAYGLTYAHSWTGHSPVSFGFEVPFVATPSQFVHSNNITVPRNYASIFVTPGLRVKLAPKARISPWGSIGGGYARFDESTTLVNGQKNTFLTGKNSGALEYGGGVDFKAPKLSRFLPSTFRVEIRNFYAGQPRLNLPRTNDRQNNVVVSGGFVLHF
jgi:hypothetical protein